MSIFFLYFAYYGAGAASDPFLAIYLQHTGFSSSDIAYLLALLPIVSIFARPLGAFCTDVLGSSHYVLRIAVLGALVLFAMLEFHLSYGFLIFALLGYVSFRTAGATLLDVAGLQWASQGGKDLGQLRAWGAAGSIVFSFTIGLLIRYTGPSSIVHAVIVLLCLATLAALAAPTIAYAAPQPRSLPPAHLLLRRPKFLLLLLTATFHHIGLAMYGALFPAYLGGLSSPSYAGAALAIGGFAEFVFLLHARRVIAFLGLPGTLLLAYGVSAVRWLLIALCINPLVLVITPTLHAFSFGAYYVSIMQMIDAESPPELRASAQGLYGSLAWGPASAGALALAGWLLTHGGMRGVFLVSTAASMLASVVFFLCWRAYKSL